MGFKDDYRDSIDDQYDHERSGKIRGRMQWRRDESYVTLSSDEGDDMDDIQTTDNARDYLGTRGDDVRPVTQSKYVKKGWRWYSIAAQQMLTDADLIEYAKNVRDFN